MTVSQGHPSDPCLLERHGAVAQVLLNRPERLNALTRGMLEALLGHLEALAKNPEIRVVVLSGVGRGFCAGGDLAAGLEEIVGLGSEAEQSGVLRRLMQVSELLHTMPQITIAAVNGPCAGAGLSLACACDLRLAAASAIFTTGFLTVGLSGDFGGSWTLSRIVGPTRARWLYLTGERLTAHVAQQVGLVGSVSADEALGTDALSLAERLASSAPLAVGAIKQNVNDALRCDLGSLLDLEARRHVACMQTEEARRAAAAFRERAAGKE